jgi:hypothetical protein
MHGEDPVMMQAILAGPRRGNYRKAAGEF